MAPQGLFITPSPNCHNQKLRDLILKASSGSQLINHKNLHIFPSKNLEINLFLYIPRAYSQLYLTWISIVIFHHSESKGDGSRPPKDTKTTYAHTSHRIAWLFAYNLCVSSHILKPSL